MVELGRLRVGTKNEKGLPVGLQAWRLTSENKEVLESAAAIYGGEVKTWAGGYSLVTESDALDVAVVPGMEATQAHEEWKAGRLVCRCDGKRAVRDGVVQKCSKPDCNCDLMTRLPFLLPEVAGLGAWLFVTSSRSGNELLAMHRFMASLTKPVRGKLLVKMVETKREGQKVKYPEVVLHVPMRPADLLDSYTQEPAQLPAGGAAALGPGHAVVSDAGSEAGGGGSDLVAKAVAFIRRRAPGVSEEAAASVVAALQQVHKAWPDVLKERMNAMGDAAKTMAEPEVVAILLEEPTGDDPFAL